MLGGITGAVLLLSLPPSAFKDIVPAFIAIALVLIVFQPRLSKILARHRPPSQHQAGRMATAGVFASGIYGGYFGAAQGILLLAILTLALDDDLQRINASRWCWPDSSTWWPESCSCSRPTWPGARPG